MADDDDAAPATLADGIGRTLLRECDIADDPVIDFRGRRPATNADFAAVCAELGTEQWPTWPDVDLDDPCSGGISFADCAARCVVFDDNIDTSLDVYLCVVRQRAVGGRPCMLAVHARGYGVYDTDHYCVTVFITRDSTTRIDNDRWVFTLREAAEMILANHSDDETALTIVRSPRFAFLSPDPDAYEPWEIRFSAFGTHGETETGTALACVYEAGWDAVTAGADARWFRATVNGSPYDMMAYSVVLIRDGARGGMPLVAAVIHAWCAWSFGGEVLVVTRHGAWLLPERADDEAECVVDLRTVRVPVNRSAQ